jgi:uncharacterized protein with GYD domain
MPKFLWQASYNSEGVKGLLKDGGSARRSAIEKMVGGLGGSVEAMYYAFGEDDVYVIADLPDDEAAAAAAMTVGAQGSVSIKTVVLMTPEQVDDAAKRSVDYRPPGG